MTWSNFSTLSGKPGWVWDILSQSLVWRMVFWLEHSGQGWEHNETRRLEEKEEEGESRTLIWIKLMMTGIDRGSDLRPESHYISSLPLSLVA